MIDINKLVFLAAEYDKGDPRRINHFVKVHAYAKLIGEKEGLDKETLNILEAAAVLHDIGIHNCEKKYQSVAGEYQQKEGVLAAKEIFAQIDHTPEEAERVCFLIAHHHTYKNVSGKDWRILLESDFIVNAFEDGMSEKAITEAEKNIFRTETGKHLLKILFDHA